MRILLVENNSDHIELMRLALSGHDSTWEVEAVAFGEEALSLLLGGEVFDLVFLDYSLLGRDGLEVLEEIRRGEAPPPVVVVTGRGDEQVAVKAMKGGAYDYVVKGAGYLQRLPVVARRAVEAQQFAVERKRAEKALQESEERLRTIVEASLDAIIAVNTEGRLVLFNGAAQELFQYSEEEVLNQPVDILLREEICKIHQERLEKFLKRGVGQCGHIGRRTERPFRRKDGSLFEAEVSMSGGRLDGLRLVVLAIHDITSRKRAEEELRESEERYRRLVENAPEVIYSLSAEDGTITSLNPAFERITGWLQAEWLGKPFISLVHPDDLGLAVETFQQVLRGGGVIQPYELRILSRSGEYISGEFTSVPNIEKGKVMGEFGIARDITERKRAEELLRHERQRFSVLSENAPFGMAMMGKDGSFVYSNPKFKEILGYDLSDIPDGKTWFIKAYPDPVYRHTVIAAWAEDLKGVGPGEKRSRVSTVTCKDGTEKIIDFIQVQMETGVHIMTCEDITERKRSEEMLRQSRENYRSITDNALNGIYQTTKDGKFLMANPAFFNMLGYALFEEMATSINDITHQLYVNPEDREYVKRTLENEDMIRRFETQFYKKDGSKIWVSVNMRNVRDADGTFLYYEGIDEDITERKRAEAQLYASLQEKEILIREVHHRVKNNMQVMSGLLDLQAASSGNQELIEMLNESQRRIRAMALVHEKLYDSKDFTRIDLAGYTRTLSQDLFQAYKINPGEIDLIIQIDSDVYVDINKAIPCGLVLNELISNALKHAFPGDKPGKLEIIIRETKNTEIEIVVRDNGLGVPDDVDIHQPPSVGLHLVNGLVINQLDGQIEVIRGAGTEFRIKFPLLFVENRRAT
ncbi:MAG: PAS domain S-box protein [Proteobacteria bacterium]|nr:PAS domain S-box protein [Pseudomonadota bacterium]